MKNLKNLMIVAFMSTLTLAPMQANAQRIGFGNDDFGVQFGNGRVDVRVGPRGDGRRVQPPTRIVRKVARLNKSYTGQSVLPLRRLLGINSQFRGSKLVRVVLFGSTKRGRGSAQLLINQNRTGFSQTVGARSSRYVFTPDFRYDILGRDIGKMELALRGKFQVERIVAVLEVPRRGGSHDGHRPGDIGRRPGRGGRR